MLFICLIYFVGTFCLECYESCVQQPNIMYVCPSECPAKPEPRTPNFIFLFSYTCVLLLLLLLYVGYHISTPPQNLAPGHNQAHHRVLSRRKIKYEKRN